MHLLCTPNSLYSRVVRVVALELGMPLTVDFVGVRAAANRLLNHNPTGKVPTLLLEDGHVLAESRSICEFLEAQAGTRLLAPVDDIPGRELEGLVTGFIDGVAVWVRELRRDKADRSSEILALEQSRAHRCLQHFEDLTWPTRGSYAAIALVCALDLMPDFVPGSTAEPNPKWQPSFPKLAIWHQQMSAHQMFSATKPVSSPA